MVASAQTSCTHTLCCCHCCHITTTNTITTIRSGEGIIALNQSANRDEDVFDSPDRFDIR